MPDCPLCNQPVANQRGLASHFRHQSASHPDYETWLADQKWAGKTEPQDFVSCRECGLRAAALTGHLRTHGLTAEEYRLKHGAGAALRTSQSSNLRNASLKGARASATYEGLKFVLCPSCGASHEVHKLSTPTLCPSCTVRDEEALWEGKTEPQDYVSCLECSYRAENLTSHVQSVHPSYRERHPVALVVALGSSIRDKTLLKGTTVPLETRLLMSQNAGRWNAGLTKASNSSLRAQSQKMRGKISWNRGLTVQTSDILRKQGEKLSALQKGRPCVNGLRADLTLQDFAPVLDEHGRVDRLKAMELLGFSWNTISKYLCEYGLGISDVNILARQEGSVERLRELATQKIVRLTSEQLQPYRLKNGKLVVAWAASRLNRGVDIIRREADRHGIPRFQWGLSQGLCLGTVSEALGGAEWVDEWQNRSFTNPESSYMYKFDGYFPEHGLVVEYHGHQHFIWPNAFYKTEESYLALRRRDAHKKELVLGDPALKYLEIRFDEPFDNPSYIRGRLFELLTQRDGITHQDLPSADTLDLFGC